MALPNLIIAGAPKCGTSSLFRWIADHPEAEGAAVKETCYFVDPQCHVFDPSSNFASSGLAAYQRFFPVRNRAAKIRLEATPVYLYQASARQALPDIPTAPRFLFILREPARQVLSTYRYFSNNWTHLKRDVGFAAFVDLAERRDARLGANELLRDALANARYVEHLARWRERLGAARMRILLLEHVQADPNRVLGDTARWLGLDPGFYRDYGFPKENETYRVRSRAMQAANLRLRGLLAKTPVYKPLRALYRGLNTGTQPAELTARDLAALADLGLSYGDANARLAEMFDLDLTVWRAGGPAACR